MWKKVLHDQISSKHMLNILTSNVIKIYIIWSSSYTCEICSWRNKIFYIISLHYNKRKFKEKSSSNQRNLKPISSQWTLYKNISKQENCTDRSSSRMLQSESSILSHLELECVEGGVMRVSQEKAGLHQWLVDITHHSALSSTPPTIIAATLRESVWRISGGVCWVSAGWWMWVSATCPSPRWSRWPWRPTLPTPTMNNVRYFHRNSSHSFSHEETTLISR